jgi:ATP-dependent Lhr-like helicase
LCGLCEVLGVPEEFFAHHGNLSREHREDAERRLKEADKPQYR